MLSNASFGDVEFVLPDPPGKPWRLRLDSGSGEIDPDDAPAAPGAAVAVAARSMRLYSR